MAMEWLASSWYGKEIFNNVTKNLNLGGPPNAVQGNIKEERENIYEKSKASLQRKEAGASKDKKEANALLDEPERTTWRKNKEAESLLKEASD